MEPQNEDGFVARERVGIDVKDVNALAWERCRVGPYGVVKLVLHYSLVGRNAAVLAGEVRRRFDVVGVDNGGFWGVGFEEGEGFSAAVVLEFVGEDGVAVLEAVEDSGERGGDLRQWFGDLEG